MPRPRARTLGWEGGGGGPIMASRGSESDCGDCERCRKSLVQLLLVTSSGAGSRGFECGREADDEDVEERLSRRG